jgi:hypothetical protein
MPTPRTWSPTIAEASHPALRLETRAQLEPGEGMPSRLRPAAIETGLAPSAYSWKIRPTMRAWSGSISRCPVPDAVALM